jgi:regulatory protein YycH of two-component signal transduction system YycFG
VGVTMTQDATVDQLRRYLQEQLVEAEDISNINQRKQRIMKLESALFEAIEFVKSIKERELVESIIFEESSSVRLISSSNTDEEESIVDSESCPECDEPQSSELSFCQVCGYQKK